MKQALITRPATKPAAKTAVKATGSTFWAIAPAVRPDRGNALMSHTHAALQVLGVLERPAPKNAVSAFIGDAAISYHKRQGNMDVSAGKVGLTAIGMALLQHRLVEGSSDQGTIDAYVEVMTKGPKAKVDWVTPDQLVAVQF